MFYSLFPFTAAPIIIIHCNITSLLIQDKPPTYSTGMVHCPPVLRPPRHQSASATHLCAMRHMTASDAVSCVRSYPYFCPWPATRSLSAPGGAPATGPYISFVSPPLPSCVILRFLSYYGSWYLIRCPFSRKGKGTRRLHYLAVARPRSSTPPLPPGNVIAVHPPPTLPSPPPTLSY